MKSSSKHLPTFIWSFLKHYKWKVWGIALSIFIASSLTIADSYLLKILIDKISSNQNNFDFFKNKESLSIVVLFIMLNICHNFTFRVYNYLHLRIFPEIRFKISSAIFSYLTAHCYQYFQKNMTGALANKIQNISENIENIFTPVFNMSYIFFIILMATITAYTINIYFALFLIIWVLLFVSISLVLSKSIMVYSQDLAEGRSILSGRYVDSLMNIFNINIFSRQIFEKQYLDKISYEVMKKDIALRWKLVKLWAIQGILCSLILGVIVFTLIFLRSKAIISTGEFVFIITITITIIQQVLGVAELIARIIEQYGICNQAFSMIYVHHNITDTKNAKPLKIDGGEIAFKNVRFGYTKKKTLFYNLNLKIISKQKVGLVGCSGSGKTTFVNMLLRLFDIQEGEIQIDKQNIKDVTLSSLREYISFIPQNPTLFHRSFMDNIRYGKLEASGEEVIEAAKKANVHEFILSTPQGYNSLLGENGIKISGGQRQRIAIARAILKNSPILILDEATSSLDSVTEALIQEGLKELMHDKTVIIIAHRLSTLLMTDRILVLDQGKIIEDGSHHELITKNRIYSTFWNSQIGGFLKDSSKNFA